MSLYTIGYIIRQKREERGVSQEELAEGLCSVPTLSRIEHGQRIPSKSHFTAFMERLGYGIGDADVFISKEEIEIHELQFRIRQEGILHRYSRIKPLLAELETLIHKNGDDPVYLQFLTANKIFCEDKSSFPAQSIPAIENALRITVPRYGHVNLQNLFLSFDELTCLNAIALYYCENNLVSKGLQMYSEIKEYMEEKIINPEERMRLYPAIVYNMSNYLGRSGYYQECIDLCCNSIPILQKYGRAQKIYLLNYNIAWCYEKLDKDFYQDKIIKLLLQSYYFALMIGNTEVIDHAKSILKSSFPDALSNIYCSCTSD